MKKKNITRTLRLCTAIFKDREGRVLRIDTTGKFFMLTLKPKSNKLLFCTKTAKFQKRLEVNSCLKVPNDIQLFSALGSN